MIILLQNEVCDTEQDSSSSLGQTRIEEFAMGGYFRNLGTEPTATGGHLQSKGEALSCQRHGGVGAEPPALENLAFFSKIT